MSTTEGTKIVLSDLAVGIVGFLMIVGIIPLDAAWVGLSLFLLSCEISITLRP